MDFAAILFLLAPLIALYTVVVQPPPETGEALKSVGLILLSFGTYLAAGLLLLKEMDRRGRKGSKRAGNLISRFRWPFNLGLFGVFMVALYVFRWRACFESLLFSSDWFLVSDLLLLLPFVIPYVAFHAIWRGIVLRSRGIQLPWKEMLSSQLRPLAVALGPQLLYLNIYRTAALDKGLLGDLLQRHPSASFALAAAMLFVLFSLSPWFIRLLYPRVPLDRFPKGAELLDSLGSMSRKTGFQIRGALVWITGSQRVANAAVAGVWGRGRKVFVTDRLLETLSLPELTAVVAHEVGHVHFRHLLLNFFLALGSSVFVMWILVLLFPDVDNEVLQGVLIIALQAIYILGVFSILLRRFEYQADLYAAQVLDQPELISQTLLRLADLNGVATTRKSLTHPSIDARVKRLESLRQKYGADFEVPLKRGKRGNVVIVTALLAAIGLTMLLIEVS